MRLFSMVTLLFQRSAVTPRHLCRNVLLAASGPVVNPSRATYDMQLIAPADRSGALRHGVALLGGQRQCKPASLIIARLLWVGEWWHAYVGARGCRGPGLGLVQASTASRADPC